MSVVLTIKNIFTENKSILYQTVQKRADINCSPETSCSQTFSSRRRRTAIKQRFIKQHSLNTHKTKLFNVTNGSSHQYSVFPQPM